MCGTQGLSKTPPLLDACLEEGLLPQFLREPLASSSHLLPCRGGWQGWWAGADRLPGPWAHPHPLGRGSGAGSGSVSWKAAAPHCRGPCGPPIRRAPLALPLSRPTVCRSHPTKLQAGRCPVHEHHLGAVRDAGAAQETRRSAPRASWGSLRGREHVAAPALASVS